MLRIATFLLALSLWGVGHAKMVKDTISTRQGDKIILAYTVGMNGDDISIRMDNKPRIIPSESLRKACKGDLSRLKVVLFDRVGDFGGVKWKGMTPKAFMVPSGLSYDKGADGYYIFGESTPLSFTKRDDDSHSIRIPLYIAVYEKKQNYKLVGESSESLDITVGRAQRASDAPGRAGGAPDIISFKSVEEGEGDNEDITKALSSMQMIRQLLATENEVPFSQTLQMEIYNLRSLKDRVSDVEVIEKINEVLMLCNDKERELKEAQKEALSKAQAREQAQLAQQKADEEARQKEAEEKSRIQEEKQQKRTLWMIIGGVVLAVVGFIGNAVFKHFRDLRNQKSIMEMQESLAKQAEHEAARRAREIARNKAHQAVNKGKSKMRESLRNNGDSKKNSDIKSI